MNKIFHFAVIAVDGTLASTIVGPIELLHACRQLQLTLPELPPCHIGTEVLSPGGQTFLSTTGYRHSVDGDLHDLPDGSVILLPGFGLPMVERVPELLRQHATLGAWLVRQHAAGCTIAAWASGSFLLAEHGLLPGGRATTYWAYAESFRTRYPRLVLDLDARLIEDERVLCGGGLACGTDVILAVVERFLGAEVVRLCTKLLSIENRPPSELRYEQRQAAVHNDPLIERAIIWIRGNLHTRLTVDDVLQQIPTSRRNLSRRFRSETGESVQGFIQRMRIDRAKLLLETSDLPVERIVSQVGYQDSSAFSRQFKRQTQLTPNQYRQRFGLATGTVN